VKPEDFHMGKILSRAIFLILYL